MPPTFKTLADPGIEVGSFTAALADPERGARLAASLKAGSVRPEWCRLATDSEGRVLARQCWWGLTGAQRPMGVDLLSAEQHDAAVALLVDARDRLAVDDAWCQVTAPTEAAAGASEAHPDRVAVLTDADFEFEVGRITVHWTAPGPPRHDSGRLAFRPAHELDDGVLVSLFGAVTDGSLDHGMVTDRAELGAGAEARQRLQRARDYPGQADWFSIALDAEGDPVGYVVASVMDDAVAVVAEVGVARAHRGRGYVDDLLSRATGQLVATGAERIVADTDLANAPMRAAFRNAGYHEQLWRDDFRWRRGGRA